MRLESNGPMEPRSLHYIARACHGRLSHGSTTTMVHRVCADSRQVQPQDLFFALTGPRFDGHNFVAEVGRKHAAGVVVAADRTLHWTPPCAVLQVDNPRQALGRLAAHYRSDFDLPFIAVAGSNGKTTTKNLLAAVLSQHFPTLASQASYNNDVGVPLTLLRLDHTHKAAVLEAGTNHPGELAPLLRMIQPRFGVLTSLGGEHLEYFNDLEGVCQEEGWLAEQLPPQGRLFVNGDSPGLTGLENRCPAPIVRVGLDSHNAWRASNINVSPKGTTFQLLSPREDFNGLYHIQLLGRHQVRNALLALAVGAELNLNPAQIRAGLAHCPPANMRLQLQEIQGVQILDDTYNANVDSMRAALETCRDLPCAGRRIAVLGDMAELGKHSPAAHDAVGRLVAQCGLNVLVAVGQWRHDMAAGAQAVGLSDIHHFETVEDAAGFVREQAQTGDMILLKASRASGFERMRAAWREET